MLVLLVASNNGFEIIIVPVAYVLLNLLVLSQCFLLVYRYTLIICLTIMIGMLCFILSKIEENMFRYIILTVFFNLMIIFSSYYREKNTRIFFALKEYSDEELRKTENLLSHMMPSHVYNNLKEEKTTTDLLSEVTLLYADIVGFTAWSSDKTPKEVVGMLYELFSKFDQKCVEHDVYKVHTIGDCYVAIGYKGDAGRDPSEESFNVINFAYSMIEIINVINAENNSNLNMRIGIHTGSIIGGIAGTNIVRYDIYGKDVLITNQIESNGLSGRISVSETTKNLIEEFKPGCFNFNFHKEISIHSINTEIKAFIID